MRTRIFVAAFLLFGGGLALVPAQAPTIPPVYLPPTFATPAVFSVAGREVGVTGIYSMTKGDFDGDGIPDIAVAGFGGSNGTGFPANTIAVYLGNGNGTFAPPTYYAAGPYPIGITSGHLFGANTPLDLVVVDAGSGNNISVLRGNGDGTFQPPVTAASFPTALTDVTIGDFNHDGKADLAVAAFGGAGSQTELLDSIGILLSNGDGTFQPPVFYQSINNPYGIQTYDFNNDGTLDLLVRNPEGLYLSLGNGDGTFLPGYVVLEEPSTLFSVNPPGPILNGPVSFTVTDFNKDGALDFAVSIDGARLDVMLGTGAGTFVPSPTPTYLINQNQSGHGGGQIVAGTLTSSGNIDLVVTSGYGATLYILHGKGDGTFEQPIIYPCAQANVASLVVGDFNGDGRADLVTGTSGAGSGSPRYLNVLLNQGSGGFGEPPPLFSVRAPANQATTTNAVGVTLADLTGQGQLDLVTTDWDVPIEPLTNGQIPEPPTINPATQQIDTHGTISVLAGNGNGTFQSEQQYYVGGRPIAVQAGDLTHDGKKDIVVVNAYSSTVSLLKGNGDRTFQPALTIPVGANPNALVLADLDGDGKLDIAVTNLADNNISVLINQSSPGTLDFKTPVTYPVGTYPSGIVARDFNHDGSLDLAVVNSGDFFSSDPHTSLSILKGNGDGTFAPAATQQLWVSYSGDAIVAADFGRGEFDLAVANFGTGEIMILQGQGDATFTKAGLYLVGNGPEGIVAMDFNGDGKVDLAVNNLNDNNVTLLTGKGDGAFIPAASRADDKARPFGWATWGYPAFIAAGDLTGDGKPEIVVTHLFEAAVGVLRNTSTPVDDVLQLLKISSVRRAIDGHAVLQCRAVPNQTVRIEASSDLSGNNYVPIGSVETDGTGAFRFEDSDAANFSQRFYRLVYP